MNNAAAKASEQIREVSFTEELGSRYLTYALSTIMSRSLPDVRDGLKPVHRRLLYAMLQLKLDPASGFKKCARVVGDVIGKYHPHGDVAVYDALVRLAQGFSVRYPLVEGQGNFGSIDGDNAAAMRYTEARLTEVALALLSDIQMDTVDFRDTYDGSEREPMVLPAAFPNLLANGSEGIAVGMATSVPPHNAGELCDALLKLIKHPNTAVVSLANLVPGPDFPGGGILAEPHESVVKSYETGKGSFRLRARWQKEDLGRGAYQIVVTEMPYQVQKSRLVEHIAELLRAKKLALLDDVRDESAEDIRLVLVPKSRTVSPEILMEALFKTTDLEVRVQLNLNVLGADSVPKVMNLREALQAFLDHRHAVLVRTSRFRIEKIAHRLEVLGGLLIAYLNLDELIRILRAEDEPKPIMMEKWKLTDIQAEAILNMRLRNLRKLEEMEIRDEHNALSKEKQNLETLLRDDEARWQAVAEEIREIKKKFGQKTELGKRRTEIADAPSGEIISIEAFVEKEPITVFCSEQGWIRAMKGHLDDISHVKYKEGDAERFVLQATTTDRLLVFATDGRFFTVGCDKLPSGKGHGEALRLMIDLEKEHDICALLVHRPEGQLLVASSIGKGFLVDEREVIAQTRTGKQVLHLAEGARAAVCVPASGDSVAVVGQNRKLLIFAKRELPAMKRGAGVILQKYRDGGLSDAKVFNREEGLAWTSGDRTRTETALAAWIGARASAGRLPPQGFPRSNRFN